MSEEILKALMQLFALIVKQDGGMLSSEREYVHNFLEKQLSPGSVSEYIELFDINAGPLTDLSEENDNKPPSVKDSVKIFSICKKINRTLNQSQKVVVLMRLYELIDSDKRYTLQRMNIVNTVAEVFKIIKEEFTSIDVFVKLNSKSEPEQNSILKLDHSSTCFECTQEEYEQSSENIIFILWVASVDLYFIKHFSSNQLFLNGLVLLPGKVYTIAKGSSLRYQKGKPVYYSDIASHFLASKDFNKISLVAEDLNFVFPDNNIGLNDINLSESEGTLLGIMGASGSGKTTLINLLSGIHHPSSGSVRINGIDINHTDNPVEGVIGFVPQDDLLIEDLTVFQNLYFAAGLCFKDKSKSELTRLVDNSLQSLGLYEKRDLKVGSPMTKIISGGQRKRLNIALELIREPSIMFLDEPTSGLSSRDSENVIDLLRELTFKGKLIVTVIHQPSSEIFKMFDRMLILDHGGEMVYYGNPIEALIHFKTLDAQIESSVGECPTCGNINPETIFNIIETEVVDEFGRYTGNRKMSPTDWSGEFKRLYPPEEPDEVKDPPPSNLSVPSRFKQFRLFTWRDILSKISNRQYVILTLLEAPVLGFMLSYIIKYIADPSSKTYIFRENENIPIYIFMSLIVALFLGLITSAEEIFKDRIILKRERFLHLNRSSYLLAKIAVLISISAIQAFLFVAIANYVLEVKSLFFQYWLAFFTTASCANLIGLNISSSFNSAITIYIVVPMVMIPMMVLSGAMFPFDKLNRTIGSVGKVPVIAEIMPTKWTYEALMVTQAKDNNYDKLVYGYDKQSSQSDFYASRRLMSVQEALDITVRAYRNNELSEEYPAKTKLIKNEIEHLMSMNMFEAFGSLDKINPVDFNHIIAEEIEDYIQNAINIFNGLANSAEIKKDIFINSNREALDIVYDNSHNQKLEEIVKKIYEQNKILEYKDRLIQNVYPIYLDPEISGPFSIRTHFFSPRKKLFGRLVDTYAFNISIVWLMSIGLYVLLYFNGLELIVKRLSRK
jgi:ABC-type multidrug transport system ATPase subunit/ABC-type multidrug transport system permease subunit